MRALIVDDSALARKTINDALKLIDIEDVDQVKDGVEAVERAAANSYDVILMDWNMPHMDGIRAVEKIRETDLDTPIIMVTGLGDEYHIKEAISKGVNNIVVKPFNLSEAAETIKETLEQCGIINKPK